MISMDHPNIPSSVNESSRCQYETINAVCSFNMQCSAGHTCKHCTIIFSLFTTISNQKWSKHVDITIGKSWFLVKSIWWQVTHLLLANFSSKSSTINALWYHWFHSTCAVDNPIYLTSKFINGYSSNSMCYFLMVISHGDCVMRPPLDSRTGCFSLYSKISLSFHQLEECLFLSRNGPNL